MKALKALSALILSVALSGIAYASDPCVGDPLTMLMEGNKNFTGDHCAKKDASDEKRAELCKGQKPFATVLTCSDSRVAPEIVFDRGLGEIFVVRLAGNVVDPLSLGSIEYSAEHLHTPLLVILGHQYCGAVKAALEAKGKPEGNIGKILKKIAPAVLKAKKAGKKDDAETLDLAVQENVRNVYDEIMKKSPIVKELVHEGKLKVVKIGR